MLYILQAQRCTISIELNNDNYQDLRGKITGPPETPYENGTFNLEIQIPETYPFRPPKVSLKLRKTVLE